MKDEATMSTDRPMGIEITQADQELAERLCFGMSEKAIVQAATLIARHRQSSIASPTYAEGRADVDYWNSVAVGLGHESVCKALEALERFQESATSLTDAPDAVRGVWMPIATVPLWTVAIVTDGQNVAKSQLAEDDDGLQYWAVDPEDGLDWEPTHWVPDIDDIAATPPAKDDAGRLREALQNCVGIQSNGGNGGPSFVRVSFKKPGDQDALYTLISAALSPQSDEGRA